MKYLVTTLTFASLIILSIQSCKEKCEVCTECKSDFSNYPQSSIDSTDCIDKELCGDALEKAKNGEIDIIYCDN